MIDANEESQIAEYGWDNRNRLVQATERDSLDGPATQVVNEFYDVENRWIGRVVDPDGETGTADLEVTSFAYAGNQIILEFDGTRPDEGGSRETGIDSPVTGADLSHRYLWGAAVDQLLADEQLQAVEAENGNTGGHDIATPGNVVWALTDHLGTIRDLAVRDSETGVTSVANHRVFDAYGNMVSQTNAAVDCLFGFTGRPADRGTGLQNNLNRWYDPIVGRWVSEDLLGIGGSDANTNRYCGNSPAHADDPQGLVDPTGFGDFSAAETRERQRQKDQVADDKMRVIRNKVRLSALAMQCALLSDACYTDDKTIAGWTIVQSIERPSGLRAVLYRSDKTGEYVLAFAGTNDLDFTKDVLNDAAQALGRYTEQYREAIAIAEGYQNDPQYRNKVTYTGHSLGGGLAVIAALATSLPAIVFNPAYVSVNVADLYNLCENNHPKVQTIYLKGEALAVAQRNLSTVKPRGTLIELEPIQYSEDYPYWNPNSLELHRITTLLKALGLTGT